MLDKVTASFKCINKQEYDNYTAFALMASDAKEWTDYTPAGILNISIYNDKPSAKFFELHKTYKLTFEAE